MESTSDKGTTGASRAYLLGTIDEVRRILDDPSIPEKDVDGLEAVLFNILTAVTPTELGDLLSKRLVAIAEKSPNELAAIANPAVQLLKRRPLGREHPEASQFKILLAGSDAYPLEEIGELILEENPYYENTDGILTEAQITAAQTAARRGGPFQFFNTLSTWEAGKPGPSMTFPRIPHPGDAPPPRIRAFLVHGHQAHPQVPERRHHDGPRSCEGTEHRQDGRDRVRPRGRSR